MVNVEKVSANTRRLTVTVPSSRISNDFESRLKRTAKTIKINGFRPGKVPLNIVRRDYGAAIYQDTVNEVVRETLFEAIEQEKLNAVDMPSVEKMEEKEGNFVYEALVEVYPEVEIKGFGDLTIERKSASVNDADVDTMIENLRKQRQTWTEKTEAAANDDQVTIDFEGSIDGEKFEGGSAENFSLVLGSNRMIPGFEDGIVGLKTGEEKIIDVAFPADYQAENLAGKNAQFKINVKKVEQSALPEVDAEFLKVFGISEEDGIAKLKADVRKNMEREVKNGLRNQVKTATFDAIAAANDFEIPKAMIKQEIDRQRQRMISQFTQQFGAQAVKAFDDSLLPDELFEEQATKSVKLGVLISQILESTKIEVDQERVKAYIEDMASSYEDQQEVIEYFTNDPQQRAQIEAVVLEDQVVDHILSQAKVTDTTVTYQQLLQEQQANQG